MTDTPETPTVPALSVGARFVFEGVGCTIAALTDAHVTVTPDTPSTFDTRTFRRAEVQWMPAFLTWCVPSRLMPRKSAGNSVVFHSPAEG